MRPEALRVFQTAGPGGSSRQPARPDDSSEQTKKPGRLGAVAQRLLDCGSLLSSSIRRRQTWSPASR